MSSLLVLHICDLIVHSVQLCVSCNMTTLMSPGKTVFDEKIFERLKGLKIVVSGSLRNRRKAGAEPKFSRGAARGPESPWTRPSSCLAVRFDVYLILKPLVDLFWFLFVCVVSLSTDPQ